MQRLIRTNGIELQKRTVIKDIKDGYSIKGIARLRGVAEWRLREYVRQNKLWACRLTNGQQTPKN